MKLILSILLVFNLGYADQDAPEVMDNSDKIHFLWAEFTIGNLDPIRFYTMTKGIHPKELSLRDQLKMISMQNAFTSNKSRSRVRPTETLSFKEALYIAGQLEFFGTIDIILSEENREIVEKAKDYLKSLQLFRPKTAEEIADLVNFAPDHSAYAQGAYLDTLTLFLFCRHDRSYPCLFVMKDMFGNLVRDDEGNLWSLPALAHSRHGRPYYITNGQTPSGVHSIDSVMPEANNPKAYGKFRRAILNWIPEADGEEEVQHLLPASALDKNWWKEASLARDNGRKWLRIHGTGNFNTDPQSNFYPHFPTSGCISTREGQYGSIEYRDQRIILDKMMESMQLLPVFSNEVKIKGLLYVIELDDEKAKVDRDTLKQYGLE